uniref:Uncharacterized protein n=1 Tax=Romanomermis culicivorax TaxID=13658 RepID=A0A915JD29_ROMCU
MTGRGWKERERVGEETSAVSNPSPRKGLVESWILSPNGEFLEGEARLNLPMQDFRILQCQNGS